MKRQKSLLSLLLALLMVCNMIVPVSAEGANEPILTVTASKTELDVSEGTADVIYTVSLNPNGNNICAFQFELTAPDGMKLTQDKAKKEGAEGYWINNKLRYVEEYNEDGLFTTFEYAPKTGYFGASGGLADRCLTETATIMTIKATVDVSNAKTYTLGVSKFICYGAGSVNFGGAAPAVTDVVVKGAAHTCSADTLTEIPAKAHTCTEDGNYKYYRCTCGELYEDADAKISTTAEKVIDKAAHTDLKKTEAKKATCEENGNEAYWFCNGCNKYYTDNDNTVGTETTLEALTIKATGHDWEVIKGADGSSTHTLKCKSCNKTVDEVHADRPGDVSNEWKTDKDNHWNVYGCGTIMNKAAHTWDAGVETTPATCTKAGVKTYTCDVCKATKTEPIPVIAHQYEWKHDETNHWQECTVCHDIIDKAEHTYASHKCEDTATCTKAGCGYVKPAGQHSWNDGEVTTPATCTTDGVKTYTCKVCSETKTEPIKASGHSLTKVEAVAATCTEGGNNEYYTCSVCKKVFKADKTTETTVADETLAALGHKLTKTEAKAATCTEPGNNEYWTCSVCKKVFKADKTTETTVAAETLAALGHKMTKTPAKAATCVAEGNNEYYTCSVCNKVFKDEQGNTLTTVAAETLAKDPANHTGGTEQRGAVAASCMTAGREADTYCKGCGKLTKAGDLIPPTGVHNYKDGVCTTCGSKQPADNATIKAAIKDFISDVVDAAEELKGKIEKSPEGSAAKKILEKLQGYVSGSSRSKLQAVYNVTMNRNNADLKDGETLADGQNVTIAISEETYNALRSGAKIVESYLDKDGNAQTREINATLKQVGGGYTVTFASDKTAVYGLMTKTSSGGSSGSGSSYTSGQSFTTDLPADSINRVTVNGKKLDSKYYTVSSNGSGSIVTLTDAYLATLKAGKYTVKIENKTHVSTGTFTIKADGTLSSPKTADAGIALYAMLAVSSLMGTAVVSKKRRKA